jgi:hypothetical protein
MALTKGTNSYATVLEADSYFEDKLGGEDWIDLEDSVKSQALITATSLLDDKSWIGIIADSSQSLAWPRIGSFFDPKLGYVVALDSTEVPTRIITALYELALHLSANTDVLSSSSSVTDIEVGPIKLKQIQSISVTPTTVTRTVKPLLLNQGSRTWWRAN